MAEINIFCSKKHNGNDKTNQIHYCCNCSKQLDSQNGLFIDAHGFTFCDRKCFYKARTRRSKRIYTDQKDFDKHAPRSKMSHTNDYHRLWSKYV